MFRKVLIANRGEIALRVIRTCRALGIRTVAVYSEADATALHARFADEAVCIGPGPANRSYLHMVNVLAAAEITDADAVHPGYGFLAENADFAAAVRAMNLAFVGPSPEHLRLFGDKLSAKAVARDVGVPLLDGSVGAVSTVAEAAEAAEAAGYPVLLKAAAGGGGKGMRVVREPAALASAFEMAGAEADAAFGDASVFVEKFLDAPRHVEVQVAGDGRGEAVALGTRDCSLQRRHQKLLEEGPALGLDPELEAALMSAASMLVAHVGYATLATVEFLVQDGGFWFLEVNPRIQVEHPVTEMVTGQDLVAWQLALAAGGELPLTQEEISTTGHAIEVRINAEDAWSFTPSPGTVTGWHAPGGPGIRVDTAAHDGMVVPPYYDSLVAKVIAYGDTREHALARLQAALSEVVVEGIRTTTPLFKALMKTPEVREGRITTGWLDQWLAARRDGILDGAGG